MPDPSIVCSDLSFAWPDDTVVFTDLSATFVTGRPGDRRTERAGRRGCQ
jgi:hypothetical protein